MLLPFNLKLCPTEYNGKEEVEDKEDEIGEEEDEDSDEDIESDDMDTRWLYLEILMFLPRAIDELSKKHLRILV